MKQIILAMSGRKGAGKNTIAKFIEQHYASRVGGNVDDLVFECSFADTLKQFCIDVLGLSYESCYGTDGQKDAPTQYKWESATWLLRWKFGSRVISYSHGDVDYKHQSDPNILMRAFHSHDGVPRGYQSGPMSGRQIMQILGTDLIRETFGNVWADATIRSIKKQSKPLSVITDNRFPSEVDIILRETSGYVIRLSRSPHGFSDIHPSEASLDNYDWNKNKCFVLDNRNLTIDEQNSAVIPILCEIFNASH